MNRFDLKTNFLRRMIFIPIHSDLQLNLKSLSFVGCVHFIAMGFLSFFQAPFISMQFIFANFPISRRKRNKKFAWKALFYANARSICRSLLAKILSVFFSFSPFIFLSIYLIHYLYLLRCVLCVLLFIPICRSPNVYALCMALLCTATTVNSAFFLWQKHDTHWK